MTKSSPIEEVFPGVFKDKTGINVTENKIYTVDGYTVDPFPPAESSRNHYNDRGIEPVKYLVMHYTVSSFMGTIMHFTANVSDNRVSAHYVVSEKEDHISGGKLIQVVPDNKNAWHAGISIWGNDKNLNPVSIGIEHVNKGFINSSKEYKWFPFDEDQIRVSGEMSASIVKEYDIKPNHVLSHADIAPNRKQDPGPLFPWRELYKNNEIGAWLDVDEMDPDVIKQKYDPKESCPIEINESQFLKMLNIYGYDTTDVDAVIKAFKAHYSANQEPDKYNNKITNNEMYWAWALNAKYNPDEFDLELAGEV